ncbi:hypothetical protein [Egicoccus halophilus]|uniref:Uncharacterized protein n=1 Tax=Egicoccus halophilus TaxID=1670830 RepID=A0A8J3A760_9ACTN|nr:hypothetical protein [Egicoccus halophilus]GGI05150.1 hypothetical protein GCM10011354_12660 [Egicoccus halophilus]
MDERAAELVERTVADLRAALAARRPGGHGAFEDELRDLERLQLAGDQLLHALRRQALHVQQRRG